MGHIRVPCRPFGSLFRPFRRVHVSHGPPAQPRALGARSLSPLHSCGEPESCKRWMKSAVEAIMLAVILQSRAAVGGSSVVRFVDWRCVLPIVPQLEDRQHAQTCQAPQPEREGLLSLSILLLLRAYSMHPPQPYQATVSLQHGCSAGAPPHDELLTRTSSAPRAPRARRASAR